MINPRKFSEGQVKMISKYFEEDFNKIKCPKCESQNLDIAKVDFFPSKIKR